VHTVQGTGSYGKNQPLPEPPPSQDQVWVNEICMQITSESKNEQAIENIRPKIATIVYDDAEHYNSIQDYTDEFPNDLPIQSHIENSIDLSSLQDDQQQLNYRTQGIDDDESYDRVQAVIKHLTGSMDWTPRLNTIIEETSYDIDRIDDAMCLTAFNTASGKQRRQRKHNFERQKRKLQRHISQAIDRNGIYRVHIHNAQNDGGANRSVTSSKDLLLHYENIDDYGINGVKEGEAAIVCTGRGFLPWRANSGEIILIRCLYCADASGTIISPSDVNAQYAVMIC
jgi:hypothetical protein